jgi:hypothetical protein
MGAKKELKIKDIFQACGVTNQVVNSSFQEKQV